MYANRKNLAALFGVTTQTVYRRVKGIEALIGERYNQYGGWSDDHERCCIYKNRYTACNSERRKTNRIRD